MEIIEIDLELEEAENIQKGFETLLEIFPDADPNFLYEKAEDCIQVNSDLQELVQLLIETKEYPKKTDIPQFEPSVNPSFKEIDFSVEQFLKKFNEPHKHFLKSKLGKNYKKHSLYYLKEKFRYTSVTHIAAILKEKDYNLSLAKKQLDKFPRTRRSKRSTNELKSNKLPVNENFLNEVRFLEHEEEIVAYIKAKKKDRKLALKKAKNEGNLFECGCCYESELLFEDMLNCSEGGHLFCRNCVKRSSEILIGDGKTDFPCLNGNCTSEFTYHILRTVLNDATYEKLLKRIQEREVQAAAIPGLESCPFCEYAEIPPEGDKLFRCKNCGKNSCRECKLLDHIPWRCDEAKEQGTVTARKFVEDKMTEALTRTCWKCQKRYIKIDGCNKITCTCGAKMCFICRQPVKDYSHFYDGPNPPNNKCPLYTNDNQVRFVNVITAGEKALKEVIVNNPTLESYNPFKGLEDPVPAKKKKTN